MKIQRRSFSSYIFEKLLWYRKRKENFKYMEEEKFQNVLNTMEKVNSQKYSVPINIPNMKEIDVDGMQVFSWNDKKDIDQRVIIYLHGGAYINPPIRFHFRAVDNIAKKLDAKVILPIYPKIPKYLYKDAYEKLELLYKDVLENISSAKNITIMGDSAGGGLALGLAMYLRDNNVEQPKDIILLSPWLDVATDNPEMAKYEDVDPILSSWRLKLNRLGELWAGSEEKLKNPYVSPLFGDFKNLGKISIFVGTHEILLPDIEIFHKKLNEERIVHNYTLRDKMDHCYAIFPIREAKEEQNYIVEIINNG